MSLQQDSHASLFPYLEKENEEQMLIISGRSCMNLYEKSGPSSVYSKTLLASILESHFPFSKKYVKRWKLLVTKHCRRWIFRLRVSLPSKNVDAFGLLPTPMASDGTGSGGSRIRKIGKMNLRDWAMQHFGKRYPSANMVEAMMGYPQNWTDLNASVTPLRLSAPK